jgi:flagellar biosynthesis protein FlhG
MKEPVVITIGGGKGGIGKSTVVANIATMLSAKGFAVGLIDADLGGANLHLCVGVRRPKVSLQDYIAGQAKTLADVIVPTEIPKVWLISGSGHSSDLANLKFAQKQKVISHIRTLAADYVLIDLGAGTGNQVIDFFAAFPWSVVVSDSLPTSIENTYGFLKNGISRGLQRLFPGDREIGAIVNQFASPKKDGAYATVDEMLAAVAQHYPQHAHTMKEWLFSRKTFLIINMVKEQEDISTGKRFSELVKKYLSINLLYIGYVTYSPDVRTSIRAGKPLVLSSQPSKAKECFEAVTRNIVALTKGK